MSPSPAHTPQHPSQEWWGAVENGGQAHTAIPETLASNGAVHAEHANRHTHPKTPARMGLVKPKPTPTRTHTYATHPGRKWRGKAKTRARTPTPQTPAKNGGVLAEPAHKHTDPNTPVRIARLKAEHKPKHAHH